MTTWVTFFEDPERDPKPSSFLEDGHASMLLDRLFADPFQCYSARHEWVVPSEGGLATMEHNFTEIFRAEVFPCPTCHSSSADSFKRAMTLLLGDVYAAIMNGVRELDTSGTYPLGRMGGIGTLGITEENARLGVLRFPRLLQYAQDQRTEVVCEVTLDPLAQVESIT